MPFIIPDSFANRLRGFALMVLPDNFSTLRRKLAEEYTEAQYERLGRILEIVGGKEKRDTSYDMKLLNDFIVLNPTLK